MIEIKERMNLCALFTKGMWRTFSEYNIEYAMYILQDGVWLKRADIGPEKMPFCV